MSSILLVGVSVAQVILQAHPNKAYVASAGCDVISFMSETLTNGYAARYGQSGACEAIIW